MVGNTANMTKNKRNVIDSACSMQGEVHTIGFRVLVRKVLQDAA